MNDEQKNGNAAPVSKGDVLHENNSRVPSSTDLSKTRVSLFPNAHQKTPDPSITLCQLLSDVRGEGKKGQELRDQTAKLRQLFEESGRDKRDPKVDAAKKSLPCVTASGRFPQRGKKHLAAHTGIIQADFDHVPDISKLKTLLSADPHVVIPFTSCTGTGVKAFFRVQPPDTDDTSVLTAWHEKNAFPALTTYCQRTYGERIDQQCGNVDRLAFLGHDPEVTANWNAVPLDVDAWLSRATAKTTSVSVLNTAREAKPNKCSPLPTPVIRTTADVQRTNALTRSFNKERFHKWATERGFRGDLRTLDILKLLPADMINGERDGRVFVSCPWSDQHTTHGNGTDTVLLLDGNSTPTFHCSHDHCSDKDIMSYLDHHEQRTPGCVDAACSKTYETSAGDLSHNDAGRADRFVERFGRDLRFVPEREVWLTWERDRWRLDTDGAVQRFAIAMHKEMLVAAAAIPGTDEVSAKLRSVAAKEALLCGDRHNISDFVHLARINPRVLLPVDKLDADPWLVGAGNWVIDLRTGGSRAYTREDFITRTLACDVDPNATCPRWEKFIEEVFPDEEVRRYVWKAIGYTLTGDMREQVFFFLHGIGRNGKSVFVRTLEKYVFGKLSVRAGRGITATTERGGYPATEVAELAGARMILTSETEQGQKLNENVIKDLSGGDAMRGRNLYENAFTFLPVGKLWIVGNHKPTIRGTDGGIWRRVRLVPFSQTFEGAADDRQLPDKLAAEASGILNWCVRGCLLWQQEGLEMPDVIREAVNEYQRDEDKLADFIEDTVTACRAGTIKHADLFKAYQRHCEEHGNRPWTSRALAKALRERRWRSESTWESKCVWQGFSLNKGEPF
jgi:putative DNA primase/helicase